jgi:hypothetical protein
MQKLLTGGALNSPNPLICSLLYSARTEQAVFRFGSKADISLTPDDVRFTPKSGHWNSLAGCLLCAKSCREQLQQKFTIEG